jgi:hypothetical protein
MTSLHRRLSKLEARRPAQDPAQMVDANDLDPAVLALWLAVDIDQMTLAQLDMLEDNLRRLPV